MTPHQVINVNEFLIQFRVVKRMPVHRLAACVLERHKCLLCGICNLHLTMLIGCYTGVINLDDFQPALQRADSIAALGGTRSRVRDVCHLSEEVKNY